MGKSIEGSLQLGSRDFQQLTGRAGFAAYMKRYQQSLLDSKTGLIREELTFPRECPTCGDQARSIGRLLWLW